MPRSKDTALLPDDPAWYKDAIIYQLHIRAFCDSDGDGIGDFRGLTSKLDYLQDLGVTALWLLPFYPSPLRDDGYDIADYMGVNPAYGTMRDVKTFVREAHRRGLRVITELVLNHTSDQHAWFQKSRRAKPGTKWRDFYVWSDTTEKYDDARIIFKDFETSNWAWDPVAKSYYWHRFYSHQPDLNFDNPEVQEAMIKVLDYWLDIGVDGLRLDAVPYLYQREGTSCENLPETHQFLKRLRKHVDDNYSNRMLLAEANQWPEDVIAYFGEGKGDECHMGFHFPLMPRLFMSIQMEDRYPIIDIMQQTPPLPETAQWAIFLRNHDELTLEMVTDEERDYMYRAYAHDQRARINLGIRRRLAPLLGNNRRKIELMNGLLLSMRGTPVVYYGDEIGMGDNIYLRDRDAVRTPMQWSADRNAGFSRANPQKLFLPAIIDPEYHFETVNVEAQENNSQSLLWWMKRLIRLRQRRKVFGRGELEFLQPENPKVLSFIRKDTDEHVLVVANLSRFVQCVELDLSDYKGAEPVEMFGHTRFPPIGDLPYFLTLGPHAFYWFAIAPAGTRAGADPSAPGAEDDEPPTVTVSGQWDNALRGQGRAALEAALPTMLHRRRWFGGKARTIQTVDLIDAVPFSLGDSSSSPTTHLVLITVMYVEGEPETYVVPIAFATAERAVQVLNDIPHAVIAHIQVKGEGDSGVLYDAVYERSFNEAMLDAVARRRRFKGSSGEISATPTRAFSKLRGGAGARLEPALLRAEQSNTSVIFGDKLILKLFRRVAEGVNPDLDIGRFLTERTSFPHMPQVAGFLEYQRPRESARTLAIMHGYVPNEGDAWRHALSDLSQYFERAITEESETPEPPDASSAAALLELASKPPSKEAYERIGSYLDSAELLGRRTANMHAALCSDDDDPAFSPERFTPHYQRGLYQSIRNQTTQALQLLRKRQQSIPDDAAEDAGKALGAEKALLKRIADLPKNPIDAVRIRTHGDYHLGQVLFTGRDFVIIDFEGEPARSLSERRLKRPAVQDVAGMIRSFHYAAHSALHEQEVRGEVSPRAAHEHRLEKDARYWHTWVCAAFLRGYREESGESVHMPANEAEFAMLLDAYLLEKAAYELMYELNNRPAWASIPLRGLVELASGGDGD
ncbi:MAG: maltose alpha-D-glucosyltransferase [Phycisphaeraceae bacterium]|nr:MAG: maltose alpha-D-glucosyltransferase [Phycisphaeraceae bacterium]